MRWLRWLPWVTGVAFLILYWYTAAPGVVELFDDSLEFQVVLPTFGIAHPTGYPLYTLLGGLWSRVLLPVGDWAWRTNLFSAVAGAATVGLVSALALRLTQKEQTRWPAAVVAALLFGLGATWWSQTTVAEVYALHNLFVAAILLVAFTIPGQAVTTRRLDLLFLLIGLALAHHRTTLLLLPGVALFLLLNAPQIWRPQRSWLRWLFLLGAPLLLYLYIPLRAAMGVHDLNTSYVNTWSGFWDHILARRYSAFFSQNALAVARTAADWLTLVRSEAGWVGLALLLLGFVAALRQPQQWRNGWLLLVLTALANLAFAFVYRVGDVQVFLLPVSLCLAVMAGHGAVVVWGLLKRPPAVAWAALAAIIWLLLPGNGGRAPAINRSADWTTHDLIVALADINYPPESVVIGLEGEITALRYAQAALDKAVGVALVTADDEKERRTQLAQAVNEGRPAFITRPLPGIDTAYSFSAAGPLLRVWPRGQAHPPAAQEPLRLDFANGALALVDYSLTPLPGAGQPTWQLALDWLPQQPLTQTLKVSLRVNDSAGSTVTWPNGSPVQQDLFPLHNVAATTTWLAGDIVHDAYLVAAPEAASGPLTLMIIVYDADTLAEAGRWNIELPAWSNDAR